MRTETLDDPANRFRSESRFPGPRRQTPSCGINKSAAVSLRRLLMPVGQAVTQHVQTTCGNDVREARVAISSGLVNVSSHVSVRLRPCRPQRLALQRGMRLILNDLSFTAREIDPVEYSR